MRQHLDGVENVDGRVFFYAYNASEISASMISRRRELLGSYSCAPNLYVSLWPAAEGFDEMECGEGWSLLALPWSGSTR